MIVGCAHPEDCPIANLKKNNKIVFTINVTSPEFVGHERVRIQEVRVYLVGAILKESTHKISVRLDNPGELADRYAGDRYSFVSVGRKLKTTFNYASSK